jgi:hypothetical protein
MRMTVVLSYLFAAVQASTAAFAAPIADRGVTAAHVAAALTAKGYGAEVSTDKSGDPIIRSSADGSGFSVLFYGCDEETRCASIQFTAGFNLRDGTTLEAINDWNRNKRFGKAYLDEENDPFLEYDIDLERGATTEAIENAFDVWLSVMPAFKRHIRWDEEPSAEPPRRRSTQSRI